MSLVEPETAARPNGTAGPPMMAPVDRPERRSPVRAYPREVREHAKLLYETTTETIDAIGKAVGAARSTINGWARLDRWVRAAGAPPPRADAERFDEENRRGRLMGRLFRVYGRQLATLEKRAGKDATTDEKDARTLSVLAKTLETLIALDRDDGAKATKPESVDRADYKAELARYLSRWAEEGEEPQETS